MIIVSDYILYVGFTPQEGDKIRVGGWVMSGLQVIIVYVHVLYFGITPVLCLFTLDSKGYQVLQYMSVHVGLHWCAGTWSSTTEF